MNRCFLIETKPESPITVLYIHVPGDHFFVDKTRRFVETYLSNPPGIDHNMVIVSQRREPFPDMKELFDRLGPHDVWLHDNRAYDISAFQQYSRICRAQMLMCLSGTTYLRRPGWLKRAWDIFQKYNGRGLFGACGNRGDLGRGAHAHLRTSSIWFNPSVLNGYPYEIDDVGKRYPFEHGPYNFTLWCRGLGLPTVEVDFSQHHDWGDWGMNRRGFHQLDQYDLLVGDRNTEPPYYPVP